MSTRAEQAAAKRAEADGLVTEPPAVDPGVTYLANREGGLVVPIQDDEDETTGEPKWKRYRLGFGAEIPDGVDADELANLSILGWIKPKG